MTNEHGDKNERAHQSCLIKTEKLLELLCVPQRPKIHLIPPAEAEAPCDIFPQYKTEDFTLVTIVVTLKFDLSCISGVHTDKNK